MKLTHEKIKKKYTFKIIRHQGNQKQGNDIGLHWHGNMEMLRMMEGCCAVTVSGKSYIAKEGDIIFINVGEFHSIDKNHGAYTMSMSFNQDKFNFKHGFNRSAHGNFRRKSRCQNGTFQFGQETFDA